MWYLLSYFIRVRGRAEEANDGHALRTLGFEEADGMFVSAERLHQLPVFEEETNEAPASIAAFSFKSVAVPLAYV